MDGLLIVNKPKGMTSHDVVARIRRILSQKKVGHAGTLDPDVTGVLCLCLGKGTKLARYILESEKEYRVVMKLGEITDTQDSTGKVIRITEDFKIEREEIEEAFRKFTGRIYQVPPMYSAKKVGGVPLYRLARKGEVVSREPREVFIHEIKLLDYRGSFVKFDVVCSKGTYIRTLCEDIGNHLRVGAYMYSLERLRCGDFSIKEALTLEEIESLKESGRLESRVIDMDRMTARLPSVKIKSGMESWIKHGRGVDAVAINGITAEFSEGASVKILSSEGKMIALGIALAGSDGIYGEGKKRILKIDRVLI